MSSALATITADGLRFMQAARPAPVAPNRVDVACFMGYVARRATPLPPDLDAWMGQQGWKEGPYARPNVDLLLDLPVPIEAWDTFDTLFAWDQRPLRPPRGAGDVVELAATYLGAAVRSFFAQGGRRCYVVRLGDPWPLTPWQPDTVCKLTELLPGLRLESADGSSLPTCAPSLPSVAADRTSWSGIGHLYGLPDVAFVCLPDLADIVRGEPPPARTEVAVKPAPELFVACSTGEAAPPPNKAARLFAAPRCDAAGYAVWAQALNYVGRMLRETRREVQLVAALPLPAVAAMPSSGAATQQTVNDLMALLTDAANGSLSHRLEEQDTGVASAFVQLAYPWLRTPGSADLPEQLESPDAALTGILARNALWRSTFRCAAGLPTGDIYETVPTLGRAEMLTPYPDTGKERSATHCLRQRVSLFGPTPNGLALLSDVTTSLDETYRQAGVNRLTACLVRAARQLGEESVFEPNGERLWARLRGGLIALLSELYTYGALRGATPAEAFTVRCDRSTMTQNDIDNGRLIAQIQFDPAAAIEQITVTLALNDGGRITQLSASGQG